MNENKNLDNEYKIKIIEIINNIKLEGPNDKSIRYIQKLLSNDEIIKDNKNFILEKNKDLKSKFKKKFEKQNQIILSKYTSTDKYNFGNESLIKEICVFCRQPLNNDLNNYYGNICYLLYDFFIDIIKNKEENL